VTYLSWRSPQRRTDLKLDGISIFYLGEGNHAPLSQFHEMALNKFRSLHREDPFHLVHGLDNSVRAIAGEKRSLGIAVALDARATSMSRIYNIIALSEDSLWSTVRTDVRVAWNFLNEYLRRDRRLLRRADGVFVFSPQQQIVLERYYGFPQWRTHRVPYGMSLGDISPRLRSLELMKKLGLPPHSQVACCVSDMTQKEDLGIVLQAFERVAVKMPTARLLVVGDGPLRREIEYIMLNLALGSRVVFTGEVEPDELPEHVALSDVFINLSSKTSGFEFDLLLAMALQKMIIGSELSPIATIVDEGVEGFLIRPADIPSLTMLLLEAFTNPAYAQTVGQRARAKVLDLFNVDRMVEQTLDSYYMILKTTGRFRPDTMPSPTDPSVNA
jgi:glycosyltransferase involved in cell wall biosynthesis